MSLTKGVQGSSGISHARRGAAHVFLEGSVSTETSGKNLGKRKTMDDEWSIWFTSVVIWNDFDWKHEKDFELKGLWGPFPSFESCSLRGETNIAMKPSLLEDDGVLKMMNSSAMLVIIIIIIITIAIISMNQKTQSKDHQRCPNEMSFHGPMAFWSLPGRQSFEQDGPLLVVKRS